MINTATTGGIGLVLLYAGWLIGGRYAQELIGFGRCARRWSARCLLFGSLLGGCSAAFYSWIVPIVPALRSAFVPLGGVIGAIVMANIGALLCARWEKHPVESDSELRKEK